MSLPMNADTSPTFECGEELENALHLYVDGELPFEQQPELFAHLAACDACRRTLSAVLTFRRMSRQEYVAVPPALDDAFFRRLEGVRRRVVRVDRAADRRPLWQVRTPVSLRGATTVALLLFLAGLMFPRAVGEPRHVDPYVEGVEERVQLQPPVPLRSETVYVFYPGLTVESTKLDEMKGTEAL